MEKNVYLVFTLFKLLTYKIVFFEHTLNITRLIDQLSIQFNSKTTKNF